MHSGGTAPTCQQILEWGAQEALLPPIQMITNDMHQKRTNKWAAGKLRGTYLAALVHTNLHRLKAYLAALVGVGGTDCAASTHADALVAVALDTRVDVADCAVVGALAAAVLGAAVGGVSAGGAPARSAHGAGAA